jgi:rhodanese-related sulfurtransferase
MTISVDHQRGFWCVTRTGFIASPRQAYGPRRIRIRLRKVSVAKGPTMITSPFSISVEKLARLLGGPGWPLVIDVCLAEDRAADMIDIPGSIHRQEAEIGQWSQALDPAQAIIISCQKGRKISQSLAAQLRARGFGKTSTLEGGLFGWRAAGQPVVDRRRMIEAGLRPGAPWVTRRRPKIDRAACPWLITRFIDPEAVFLFVEPDQVQAVAERTGGIAYDIPGVAMTHRGEDCSFDTILGVAGLAEHPPLRRLADIVRGADNARLDLAPEAAGLLAVSLGLSDLAGEDDHAMLRQAFVVYDGLYAWAARAAGETHNWPPKA